MPYRSAVPHASTPPPRPTARFGFASARTRIGAERFELSFRGVELELMPLAVIGVSCVIAFPSMWAVIGAMATFVALAVGRVAMVVTRQGTWVERRVAGVCWRRYWLGRGARIECGVGWDWDEIAVFPADRALAAPLHDHERAVLVSFNQFACSPHDPVRSADAAMLVQLATREMDRLGA
jgi:hypothetical protein